jgi:hypothetical protein
MWLMRRMLGVYLLLLLISAGVIGVARLNRAATALERIGFALCEGQPCFMGIKPGSSWQEAERHLAAILVTAPGSEGLNVRISEANIALMRIISTDQRDAVEMILPVHERAGIPLELTLGDVLLLYGAPCRAGRMVDVGSVTMRDRFVLVYPSMVIMSTAAVWQAQDPAPLVIMRPAGRIHELWLMQQSFVGSCATAPFATWHGLASSATYFREYLRERESS